MIEFLQFGFFSFIFLWILFANLVTIKNKYVKTSPITVQVLFKWLIAVPFVLMDVIFNIVYGTVMFLQLPQVKGLKGWTFTERCSKILKEEWASENKSWRFKIALFICHYMLEPWDPNHCSLESLNKTGAVQK